MSDFLILISIFVYEAQLLPLPWAEMFWRAALLILYFPQMFVTCHDNMHSGSVSNHKSSEHAYSVDVRMQRQREYSGPAVVSWVCVAQCRDVEWGRKCASHEGMCLCWLQPPITSQRENRHQRRSVSSHSPLRACSFEPLDFICSHLRPLLAPLQSHQIRQARGHVFEL